MYTIDEQDRVIEIDDLVPHYETGAPDPHVFAAAGDLLLWYWAGRDHEEVAVIRFVMPRAHYFGSPNDEARSGHPLYSRGLSFYGAHEVLGSSWIRLLERMNRVHPRHSPALFEGLRHFIFCFRDDMFECVAKGFAVVARLPRDEADTILEKLPEWLD